MKIQLTKTKTIEIGGSKGPAKKTLAFPDVSGVELFCDDSRGCPAVRLTCKKGQWSLHSFGFVPPPDGTLPTEWDGLSKQPAWSMPYAFQSPHAAYAVNSSDAFIRQTSGIPDVVGTPVSDKGTRGISIKMADEASCLECGIPEYQALWLSRLLPEGKRPTACSIQITPAAYLSAIRLQPEFIAADGNAMAIYASPFAINIAAYKEGELILFRKCPAVGGWRSMRESVMKTMGLDDEIIDSVLDDTLIDPRPALEPFARQVLDQLELSRNYLHSRHSLKLSKIFLFGLPSGSHYWSQIAVDALRFPLITPSAFEGIPIAQHASVSLQGELTASQSQVFLPALGAAIAAMEAGL